jgi:hypothetical protein
MDTGGYTEAGDYEGEPGKADFGLVLPFLAVKSKDGPYDDLPFVAGYQAGKIDGLLSAKQYKSLEVYSYSNLIKQIDLIAMRHNYSIEILSDDNMWALLRFTKSET